MQEIKFIIYYTALILIIAYLSGLAGIQVLADNDFISNDFSGMDYYNPLVAFNMFTTLLMTNTVPALNIIFTILFTPYLFAIVYIIWKALPFT